MAQRPINVISDRWFAQLNTSVNSSATSWVLKASGATGLPTLSALEQTVIHCGSEKALVTAVATNTPSAGLDTLTVTRGYGGSTAASHAADDFVAMYYYREYHNDTARRLAQLEYFLWGQFGKTNGRLQSGLYVQAEGTPSLTVEITAGGGFAVGQPVALRTTATKVFVAPVTNPRIDVIQIDQEGNIEVKAGSENASPTAPSVDADALKLAEIYCRVGMTSIKDTDDASNGYITNVADNWL